MPASRQAVRLTDYQAPPYLVTHVELDVRLDPLRTRVASRLHCRPAGSGGEPFLLHGVGLEFESLKLDGAPAAGVMVQHTADGLLLTGLPQRPFTLELVQYCSPQPNTTNSGLYMSRGVYCTQMEAEGFRRLAFFPDRPDIMSTYSVRMEAPQTLPVLLSNGNPGARGALAGTGWHFAEWHDPIPKSCYLFALVAGDLAAVHDSFTTAVGRHVSLGIYVEHGQEGRCAWAMECLKASMRWDEQRFGRHYDLDVFNIVAVSDFNMGAMENKGLNIFNDKYVLASPGSATDTDYANIERIIAHEYFHNWTGNRITCRDWFQLCLKEGLTVFRDQEFTSDLRSRAVKRIEDVYTLRGRQFPEDQGPLSHPVRPAQYVEINNFYTPTVYEKGAELCRMLHTLLGEATFRAGLDLFFTRHDGKAVTVEDFLSALSDASGRDLSHFALWYTQSGTPHVNVSARHDVATQTLELTLHQHTPPSADQPAKQPLHIPLALSLLDQEGRPLALAGGQTTTVVELTQAEATFTFSGIGAPPVVSINRNFTAPVVLERAPDAGSLLFRVRHETDTFNRWDAAQEFARTALCTAVREGSSVPAVEDYAQGLAAVLADQSLDSAFKALMLHIPGEAEVAGLLRKDVDADAVRAGRQRFLSALSQQLQPALHRVLAATVQTAASAHQREGAGDRALRAAALQLFAFSAPGEAAAIAHTDFVEAASMTAEINAISAVLAAAPAAAEEMLATFHARHAGDHLLLDKWYTLQAGVHRAQAAQHVAALAADPAFRWQTPNRVHALFGGFFSGNVAAFHAADGSGYQLLADAVLHLDAINPQVAARLATTLRNWGLYDAPRRAQAQRQLRRIADGAQSADVGEIITRTLGV